MRERLLRRWYSKQAPPLPLRLLAPLYQNLAQWRRHRLQRQAANLPLPVVIVGNITLGGTGKTPFVIWLAEHMQRWGWRPGIISRGYGGVSGHYPLQVEADTPAERCGDEPALLRQRLSCPIAVAPDRRAAAQYLIDRCDIDILIADDGLQHYRLPRALEFCVVDGRRGLGNGWVLPAGPLREPARRLLEVDHVVVNGPGWRFDGGHGIAMSLALDDARELGSGQRVDLTAFHGRRVHAFAGVGHPARFFDALSARGLEVEPHPRPDHYRYGAADFAGLDDAPVLMTEKDAVKCATLARSRMFAVPARAVLAPPDEERVRKSLMTLRE